MASVVYIRDESNGGNLVAHILAGERYHKRKEGITHKTWYLFNDFAITSTVKVGRRACQDRGHIFYIFSLILLSDNN